MKLKFPLIISVCIAAVLLSGALFLFFNLRKSSDTQDSESIDSTGDVSAERTVSVPVKTGTDTSLPDPGILEEYTVLETAVEEDDTVSESEQISSEPAHLIDITVTVDNIYTDAPTDDNYYTVQRYEANACTVLEAGEPICALYFVWDELPGVFYITADGKKYEYTADTYLHQTVILPMQADNVSVIMPDRTASLCDIYAFSAGYLPSWVQQWETLSDDEHADILLFPTHADDEFLFFGGIIPLYVSHGKKVQVVYMNCHIDYDYVRNHELLNGLWSAGCRLYPVINNQADALFYNYEDALYYYGWDEFTGFQVEQIRRFKPSIIVGHDFDGEYGHGTHMLNAYCLADAVELSSDPEEFSDSASLYGIWDTPKLYFHLYWENQVYLDFEESLEAFDGKTALEVAESAYSLYYSQQVYYPEIFSSGYLDCHVFGLYRTTVGYDTQNNDLFENID